MNAFVLTPWIGDKEVGFRPLLNDFLLDYTDWSWRDVTGQLAANLAPDPNLLLVELVCDKKLLAKIAADQRFLVIPETAEVSSALPKFQADCLQLGIAQEDLTSALGPNANQRAWREITTTLSAWLKGRPKRIERGQLF